ncbi:MAG: hypothetical protein NVS2B3_15800 [Vulcanimicrobiaceae bacterium]
MRRRTVAALAAIATTAALAMPVVRPQPARAIPIFAQRYALSCATCHTAVPELNDFGETFRNGGYRLPAAVPRHGTTIAAIRLNTTYEPQPAPGIRRFAPTAALVADADVGRINAYLHYNFGAGGAPGAPFLGFLSTFNAHTRTLYRAGLWELPLAQSPGQRLDSISTYGYAATSVGQNDLDLNAPRLGFEAERAVGRARLAVTIAVGEFKGAAYGGKTVFTGTQTVARRPEFGFFATAPLARSGVLLHVALLDGQRSIALPGRVPFVDAYDRVGFGARYRALHDRLEFSAEQWLGHDADADGAGDALGSSGGTLRAKYFVTPHLYAAVRLDDAASPYPTRTLLQYVGALVGKHARVVVERRVNLLRGTPTFGVQVTVAAPWPRGL